MTSQNAPHRIYIPQPFASGDGTITPEIEEILVERNLNEVNFVDGFPSPYSVPHSQGGRLVSRGVMNAIGQLATANEFARACGVITTFDPRLAAKIGGYPRGAVLEIVEGIEYHKVISLVDDNKVDFNGDTLTDDQIEAGITLGKIDNVNWAYCANGTIDDSIVVAELPNFKWITGNGGNSDMFTLGTFIAKRDGMIGFEGSYDLSSTSDASYSKTERTTIGGEESGSVSEEVRTQTSKGSTFFTNLPSGFMILCTENMDQSPMKAQADIIYSRANLIMSVGQITYNPDNIISKQIVKGHKYALYVVFTSCDVTNSTFKIKVV